MSHRLHSRRPAPHFGNQAARPIDRKGSNAGRALGGLLSGFIFVWFVVAVCVLLWVIA